MDARKPNAQRVLFAATVAVLVAACASPARAQATGAVNVAGWALSLPAPQFSADGVGSADLFGPSTIALQGIRADTDAAVEIHEFRGRPILLGARASFNFASGSETNRTALDGLGSFLLGSNTSSGDRIALGTTNDAAGVSASTMLSLADPSGGTAALDQFTFSPVGPNGTNNAAQSPSSNGGLVLGNVVTDGVDASASAFGLVADADGFLFAGTGDLTGVDVVTSRDSTLRQAELELQLATTVPFGSSGFVLSPSFGPVARYADRRSTLSTDVLLPPEPNSNARIAATFTNDGRFRSRYLGGFVGLDIVGTLLSGEILSFGADSGVLHLSASHTGTAALRSQGFTDERFSVSMPTQKLNRTTSFARLRAALARPAGRFTVSLRAEAEYLDAVPTVARDIGASATLDALDVTTGEGSELLTTRHAWSGSISFAVSSRF